MDTLCVSAFRDTQLYSGFFFIWIKLPGPQNYFVQLCFSKLGRLESSSVKPFYFSDHFSLILHLVVLQNNFKSSTLQNRRKASSSSPVWWSQRLDRMHSNGHLKNKWHLWHLLLVDMKQQQNDKRSTPNTLKGNHAWIRGQELNLLQMVAQFILLTLIQLRSEAQTSKMKVD